MSGFSQIRKFSLNPSMIKTSCASMLKWFASKFSISLSFFIDFGMGEMPCSKCHLKTIWAGDFWYLLQSATSLGSLNFNPLVSGEYACS
jgi:hypothetical protein